MTLRPELEAIVTELATSREVTLDAVGEAIGARFVTQPEIEAILQSLEARGVRVLSPEGGDGEDRLRVVVATARILVAELGRKPRPAEIAERSGLTEDQVRSALALSQIMQR